MEGCYKKWRRPETQTDWGLVALDCLDYFKRHTERSSSVNHDGLHKISVFHFKDIYVQFATKTNLGLCVQEDA